MRISEVVETAVLGRGEGTTRDYSLVADLRSCMYEDDVGLYTALGWQGTGESWECGSDEHASREKTLVTAEKSTREEEEQAAAERLRGTADMLARGAKGEVGQGARQGRAQGAQAEFQDMSLQSRQQRLNENGGEKCMCGRWEGYARVGGGGRQWTWDRSGGKQGIMAARAWQLGRVRQ